MTAIRTPVATYSGVDALTSDRQHLTLPALTADQIARIGAHGRRRTVERGEILIERGERSPRFFVVISGEVELLQCDGTRQYLVVAYGPGQFTGELHTLSARPSLVRARVRSAGTVVEVDPDNLRSLVQADGELSEILLRAFILRRVALLERSCGDVVVAGWTLSPGTLRVKEFLVRNGHPYAYVDLATDGTVQGLFDRFHVGINDVPIVICDGTVVLRNPTNTALAECLGCNDAIRDTGRLTKRTVTACERGLPGAMQVRRARQWRQSHASS